MKTRGQLVVAVGTGYLLRGWTAKLARSPEIAKLGETIRGELMNAAKAATVTAVNSRIDSLNSRLQSSGEKQVWDMSEATGTKRGSGQIRDSDVVEAEESEEEPPGGYESADGEQEWEDGALPEDDGQEQAEETDESEEAERPAQEEQPRRRPRTRRTRGASTAKEIREWAVHEGYEISARGRIPADIEQAFRDAH
ncbi:hypothetical protein CJ179_34705 [Rhodococcus sp. ACS1]|uniref:Lsr2 family DNA-binding protein n=1 Tax=Rhodococcus sp. ACS1 TaxID=2028570 RepID=UPI000BB12B88|nr:histone-like nucleoid-structuring protein Lsr2 [Rhodococcus sp. ACS1]PBC39656.1 hypothetical protein CJ179_34705 [Rhodococcus sp. ACS1]